MFSKRPPTYKLTHTPPRFKEWGWGLSSKRVFVLLRHSEITLHWLDSPELALQVGTIFGGLIMASCDVKWCRLGRHLWSTILDFTIFLKNKFRNNGSLFKIKPECLWNRRIGEFLQFDKGNWKICSCYGNVKNGRHN